MLATHTACPTAASPISTIPANDAEIHCALDELSRPRLLVDAARHGMPDYQRRRDLRRILRVAIPADAASALRKLIPLEADIERRRVTGGRGYTSARHVDVLIALMSEARDYKAKAPRAPETKALRLV